MSEIERVTLHNGVEADFALVAETMSTLQFLFMNDLITAYELVELAWDPDHQLSADAEEMFRAFNLLEDGVLDDSIRNIVRAAIEGRGFDTKLRNPVKCFHTGNA